MSADRSYDLRCTCSRRPLLARYGRDSKGHIYVHLKVFKGKRLYAESIFTGGNVRIKCRECLHWHNVIIRQSRDVVIQQSELPAEIRASMLAEAKTE